MGKLRQQTGDKVEMPAWLDETYFKAPLQADFPDYKAIVNFELMPAAGNGENFSSLLLCAKIKLQLQDSSLATISYMIKVLPTAAHLNELISSWRVFDKEINTYSNYLPEFEQMYGKVNKQITFGPKYYKSTAEHSTGRQLVMLEDLQNRGFKNVKRQEGLDMVHAKAALEKLAQFHAASAVRFEQKGAYPSIYERNLCNEDDKFVEFRRHQADILLKHLPLYEATYMQQELQSYTDTAPDMFQAHAFKFEHEFRVLNHGDAWCNNIMFQYDGEGRISETLLIDYQMSRYGSPAQDLIYLLISSVSLQLKITEFDYFVRFYHDKLTDNLKLLQYNKRLPSLRELHKSIYEHGDWVYPVMTVLLPLVLIDPTEDANMDNIMDNAPEEGSDLAVSSFSNPRIVKHLKVILPWAYNRGLFKFTYNVK